MSAYERYDNASGEKRWHYRVRVTLPDGRKVRISGTPAINTQRAALEAERAHVERVLNPPKAARERILMTDLFDRFLADYTTTANNKGSEIAAKTSAIDCHLRPELGEMDADEVTAGRIDELAAKLHRKPKARGQGTLGAKTVKNVLQTLRKSLRWAKKRGWLETVPEIEMPRVDEPEVRFLERAEQAALIAAVADEPLWYAAVLLALDAGLRQGELRALQWTDVAAATGKIRVSRSRWRDEDSSTKSRKARTVPMTPELASALDAIKATKLRGPYVLSRASDGGAFGAEYMTETIDRLARKAKITLENGEGWHTLRHTFCTNLAMEGVPANTIRELAGHASLATTMRYMHVVKGAADDAIAKLSAARARTGHEARQLAANDTEGGDVVQLSVVTPKGLEPLFSA